MTNIWDDPLDSDIAAELVTMSDQRLGDIAGDIVRELAEGSRAAGLPHLTALNKIVEEAIRRRIAKEMTR